MEEFGKTLISNRRLSLVRIGLPSGSIRLKLKLPLDCVLADEHDPAYSGYQAESEWIEDPAQGKE